MTDTLAHDVPPGTLASIYDDSARFCQCGACRNSRAIMPEPLRYDAAGFDQFGWNADGYDRDGFTHLSLYGYDTDGYDRGGYDRDGYNEDGYDADGYDRYGHDEYGYGRDGYDRYGYDRDGYNEDGYNEDGYDAAGYDRDGYNEDGYDRYGTSRCDNGDCYDDWCDYCHSDPDDDDMPDTSGIHGYSYKPDPIFHGNGPAFYGMEIEIESDNNRSLLSELAGTLGDLAYLKSDCTVRGFELVTHPMSYAYAMESPLWEALDIARADGCTANEYGENGIHVHVSRTAFASAAHMYRFVKLIYRNRHAVVRVARRESGQWAPFHSDHRAALGEHAKRHGKAGRYYRDDSQRDRYHAINTQNAETLEVRVFASTLNVREAQSALQLVAGAVEYTRHAAGAAAFNWSAFAAWIGAQGETYAALAETLGTYQAGAGAAKAALIAERAAKAAAAITRAAKAGQADESVIRGKIERRLALVS